MKNGIAYLKSLNSRDLCVWCLMLPSLAFLAGVATIYYPMLMLTSALTAAALGWLAFVKLLADPGVKQIHASSAALLSFLAYGLASAYGAGIVVAAEGTAHLVALLLAFACGLISAVLYRARRNALMLPA